MKGARFSSSNLQLFNASEMSGRSQPAEQFASRTLFPSPNLIISPEYSAVQNSATFYGSSAHRRYSGSGNIFFIHGVLSQCVLST